MTFTRDGIEKVRVIKLPGGIWADGRSVMTPRLALVKWHCSWSDKFYQIYVNGQYSGVTIDSDQRQMVVPIPTSLETAARIEVFAVEAAEAHIDFSGEINSSVVNNGRVKINFLREQNLPVNSSIVIYSDNGSGEIDYDTALTDSPIRIWPAWQDKAGFGMSSFGVSDFGFDSSAAIGFGRGCLGRGRFGLDADMFEWTSKSLQAGIYKFGVKVVDEVGAESGTSESGEIAIIPAARPAEQLDISSFDKQTNQGVLSIS